MFDFSHAGRFSVQTRPKKNVLAPSTCNNKPAGKNCFKN